MSWRVLAIPDAHFPYHDKAAWELCLRGIEVLEPDEIVIIGDFGDFAAVSNHPKHPDERQLHKEVESVKEGLENVVNAHTKNGGITYMQGNHEDRLRLYLWNKAPELEGLVGFEDLLGLDNYGIETYRYREFYKVGKVFFSHGWRTGVNAARQTVLDAGRNIVVGHSHRASIVTTGEIAGKKHFCMNIGWLGNVELVKDWASIGAYKDWALGFGVVDMVGDISSPYFVPIVETSKHRRSMILGGESYRA
jgi:metallophosphoesterase superfamily enzyme